VWKRVAAAILFVLLIIGAYWLFPRPPKTGSLSVAANVTGAMILLDGHTQPGWLTPHVISKLAPGAHEMTVSKEGYQSASQSVEVTAGAENSVLVNLPPAPQFGSLSVRANVAGATILVDGQTQSDWLTPHTFAKLAPRTYVITVQKEGYQSVSQNAGVEAGGAATLDFDLNNAKVQKEVDQFGQLRVTSNVDGAKILIDGQTQPGWLTPYTFTSLPARSHNVTVIKDGYQRLSKTVTVVAGSIRYSNLDLQQSGQPPPSGTGELVVTSDPPGAQIVIDGAGTGFTTPHTFPTMAAGSHTIALIKSGFDSTTRTVRVEPGKSTTAPITIPQPTSQFTLAVLEVSSSDPEGVPIAADVSIDGKPYGKSPVKIGLPPGQHHYEVTAGSRSEHGKFELKGGLETAEVDVKIPKD
jgi:hypothetical protein